jgi:molybdenum cofactor biosynthesis enzyme MoaA
MGRPLTLLIDVTDRCNLRCVMCHFANVDRIGFPPFDLPHGAMPVELFERIAADFLPKAHRAGLACAA